MAGAAAQQFDELVGREAGVFDDAKQGPALHVAAMKGDNDGPWPRWVFVATVGTCGVAVLPARASSTRITSVEVHEGRRLMPSPDSTAQECAAWGRQVHS